MGCHMQKVNEWVLIMIEFIIEMHSFTFWMWLLMCKAAGKGRVEGRLWFGRKERKKSGERKKEKMKICRVHLWVALRFCSGSGQVFGDA